MPNKISIYVDEENEEFDFIDTESETARDSQSILIEENELYPDDHYISTYADKRSGAIFERDDVVTDMDEDLYMSSESEVFYEDLGKR